jgi:hypothetical protein
MDNGGHRQATRDDAMRDVLENFRPIRSRCAAQSSRRQTVLNKFGPSGNGEAQLQYLDGDFRVVSPGTYVTCAVTGERIPLDELKYWSVDRQEAYAVPNAVLARHYPDAVKGQH